MPGLRSSGCPLHEWGRGAAGRRCRPSHACSSSAETGSLPVRSTRSQHAIRTLSTPARARRRSPGARLRVRTARNRAGARARAERACAERRWRTAWRTKVEIKNRVGLAEDDVHAGADVGRERRGGRQPAGVIVCLDLRRGEHAAQEGARRRGRVQEQKGGEASGGGHRRVVQVCASLRRAGLSAARARVGRVLLGFAGPAQRVQRGAAAAAHLLVACAVDVHRVQNAEGGRVAGEEVE